MGYRATIGLLLVNAAALTTGACAASHPPAPPPPPAASATASAEAAPAASAATVASSVAAPPATGTAAPVPPAPAPTSTVANIKTDGSWAPCHQEYKASGSDVTKEVSAMAKACEKATLMKLVGKTLTGKQADVDTPQSYPLDAKASHCYRVYAQAGLGIKDLDVFIKDSAGVVVGQDATDDPSPVVLEDGAVCFKKDDKASVVVSVGMGSGAYALQIWSD